jgi:hypothetical protein
MALRLGLIGEFYREVRQSLETLKIFKAQKLLTGDAEFGYEKDTFMGRYIYGRVYLWEGTFMGGYIYGRVHL